MWIDPKLLEALKNTGLTYKESGELANRFRKAFELLPTTKQLANRLYANLKYWR